jgi:hypothetical protein
MTYGNQTCPLLARFGFILGFRSLASVSLVPFFLGKLGLGCGDDGVSLLFLASDNNLSLLDVS